MAPDRIPLADRFWSKVDKTDDCWLWTGGKTEKHGYGMISPGDGRSSRGAHRISWELHYGPIPHGMWVLHRCDTPSCVRPDHLFLGDAGDNARDMVKKRRGGRGIGGTNGHLNVRLPRTLHAELKQRAQAEGVSLNTLMLLLLTKGVES